MSKDKDLLRFQYNQQNENYIEQTKKIASNPNLTPEQKKDAASKLKPSPLVEEVDEEVVIQDIEAEWRDKSVTWATMDEEAVRAQFDSDEAFSDYKKFHSLKQSRFYHRDRGEELKIQTWNGGLNSFVEEAKNSYDAEFIYMFEEVENGEGIWYVYDVYGDENGWVELSDALNG